MNFDDAAESYLFKRLSLVALVCCLVPFLIAILSLLSYLPGMSLLGSVFADYIHMAPSTALSFISLAIILTLYRYRPITGILHVGCALIAGLVSLFGLLKFCEYFTSSDFCFESLFVPSLDIPVGIMSYTTGFGFFIAGIGVLSYTLKYRLKKVPSWVGFSVGASGSFVALYSVLMLFGYVYKQLFLYGEGSTVPMTLTRAVAFLFLGLGIITANGLEQPFIRSFVGNSNKARLLRVFLPLTIFFILVTETIDSIIKANAADLITLTLLVFIGITTMVVYWIAGVIGRRIDSAEDNLRDSEKRFRSVFHQSAVGWARLSPDGVWLSVNKKLCDIVGYSQEELLSKTFQDITHPDDLEAELAYFQKLLANEIQTYSMEQRFLKKNGDLIWVNITVSLMRDTNNDPDYFISIIEDITYRKLVERTLRIERDKLKKILNSMPDGIYIISKDYDIEFLNQALVKDFGAVEGKKCYRYFHNLDEPCSFCKNDDVFAGKTVNWEWTYLNGKKYDLIDTPLKNADGTVSKLEIFRDVTERKLAVIALRESNEKYLTLMDSLGIGVVLHGPDGSIILSNPKASEILGISSEQMKGKKAIDPRWEFVKSDGTDMPVDEYPVNKALRFMKSFSEYVVGVKHPDRKYITWVSINASLVFDENNDIKYVTISFNDVTKQKQAEQAVKESEEKLNALFTSMTEMVVMHELVLNENGEAIDYRIIDCNNVFTEITGISKEDAVGKLASEVYQVNPPPYLEDFAKVALGGGPYEFNTFYPPMDKHFKISVVSPQNGNFATITTDITTIMLIQDKLIDKNKEMENYLYVASHDLRTPLVNIQGFSQRLKKQADSIKNLFADKMLEPEMLFELGKITDKDIPKTLSFVFSNIEKMDTLINGLLKLSRTGAVEMNIQKIDMETLLSIVIKNLDFQIKEAQCNIHIDSLPECYGDTALLDQLFTNIISNALKYSDSERFLDISISAQSKYNKVVYSIKDTGKGIAQKHLDRIWDIFYRIDPRSSKIGEGIGLSLVKRIVEKHKGKVWVESEENRGSVFYIELHNRPFVKF